MQITPTRRLMLFCMDMKKYLSGKYGKDYFTVDLIQRGKRIHKKNSVLMLETFVSPRPKGMWACHGVGGRYDDSLLNLYWATPKQC